MITRPGGDAGVATVWTAMALAAVLGVYSLLLWLAAATLTRHQATGAADLAALAAAAHAVEGSDAACARAGRVTDRMGTSLADCAVHEMDVVVEVQAEVAVLPAAFGHVTAKARAGPR